MPFALGLVTVGMLFLYSGLKGLSLVEVLAGKGADEKLDAKGGVVKNPDTYQVTENLTKEGSEISENLASKSFSGSNKQLLGHLSMKATEMGLTITSKRGGNHVKGSWHYIGRAFDASNSSGPTPEMMAFATYCLQYAPQLKELFYTPLGYSIKNGRKASFTVPDHNDHVHVAA